MPRGLPATWTTCVDGVTRKLLVEVTVDDLRERASVVEAAK